MTVTNDDKVNGGTKVSIEETEPIVSFRATPLGPKCPFANSKIEFTLKPGGCLCLKGNSGMGKTTLAMYLAGIPGSERVLRKLQIGVEVMEWNPNIPHQERCGVLFQQTTLLDELTLAGNLQVALQQHHDKFATKHDRDLRIKQLLDSVGLKFERDAHKYPTQLSGGMGRRASLALQLAQHKHLIVLDEPFTGLDYEAAVSVAKQLIHLRQTYNTALLLISHEPHLTNLIMDPSKTPSKDNIFVELQPKHSERNGASEKAPTNNPRLFTGVTFRDRFFAKLLDYTCYSLPLIVCAFVACGLAISMLSADLLQRLDVNDQVLDLVDKEVRPLIKMLTGEEASPFQMMGVRFKVGGMLNRTIPPAKAKLYAMGLTKLFVLEVGPLLTALLLCGRIGGSYAGKVATLEATNQNKLLRTLGVNPQWWTLGPSLLAALIAAPLLTMVGTAIPLFAGGYVGQRYGIVRSPAIFHDDMMDSLFPPLRLQSFEHLWNDNSELGDGEGGVASAAITMTTKLWKTLVSASSSLDLTVTYSKQPSWVDTVIELVTYPPIYHMLKSLTFILIIMLVAETVARLSQSNLTPRKVPSVITGSVVASGLLVILADWAFSQLWLMRF
jgi:ABC-type nitrate/sulfonate/bicarbonate transport system ATPase subunit/ABC-type transporter Mla maintaining outer membrane lipid asymmetry permease subunit MlaE